MEPMKELSNGPLHAFATWPPQPAQLPLPAWIERLA